MDADGRGAGRLVRVAGPVVGAVGLETVRLNDVVRVGDRGLVGEVIRLSEGVATVQVYEDTSGVRVGEPVHSTGRPLVAHLGPGLLGQVFDGLQRPLGSLAEAMGAFLSRGLEASPLDLERPWSFTPMVQEGERVEPGQVLGEVPETGAIRHRVLVPPDVSGRLVEIREGDLRLDENVAAVESDEGELREISPIQRWPVRRPRPLADRLEPREPLITGTRVIDAFFPVAKGGSAIIPGGFGTGKTVTEQSLARFADVDVVVYVGCGERGNEMAEVLEEFPELSDPRSGEPLMERTVLIANTSNMPVAAREASIYTGVTLAEYYRDMGYDVLLLADSTSRWGEALREISGRLEEMPGEEGFPAYLASRLAAFYERAGRVTCLGGTTGEATDEERRQGSVTLVGAVSPPGGDFSEPMTQNSMRLAGTFWALDYDLSRRRHFPAISWTRSYSLYDFGAWFGRELAEDWEELTGEALALLQSEAELQEIVQLVGPDALSRREQMVLFVARLLREDYLQQSAFDEVDRYCPPEKAYRMLRVMITFHRLARKAMEMGADLDRITGLPVVAEIGQMKDVRPEDAEEALKTLENEVQQAFESLTEAEGE